ncbi:hypothetical protein V8687_20215 [Shewanella baltica]|uniref:hypothetical protein n=1 Tax=Shewanella baltica TaxID=62322 RepID=UPI0030CC6E85
MNYKMTHSPLQMKQLIFTKISVESNENIENADEIWAPTYDFDDVIIQTESITASKEGEEDDPRDYLVRIRVTISNEIEESKASPYDIDIHAQAWFELDPIYDLGKRESIVSINGSSMVIGAIREMLTQLTARSIFGPMTLPSLRFQLAEEDSEDKE